jgi:hypothetical protein
MKLSAFTVFADDTQEQTIATKSKTYLIVKHIPFIS